MPRYLKNNLKIRLEILRKRASIFSVNFFNKGQNEKENTESECHSFFVSTIALATFISLFSLSISLLFRLLHFPYLSLSFSFSLYHIFYISLSFSKCLSLSSFLSCFVVEFIDTASVRLLLYLFIVSI